ncbi:MAG: site-specific DNA-methyltransferase [Nocardioidaceae bacterium]
MAPSNGRTARQAVTPVEALTHEDKRVNIPTADARDFVDPSVAAFVRLRYERDPSLDPQLVWRGKDAQDGEDLLVDAPPIYIQEKIDPRVLVENLRRTAERPEDEPELTLFDSFDGLDEWDAVDYYKHDANWSNRLILGDSLNVMGSLAERERLRGKVQMIYLDPPYGIKFGSNWQVSTRKRDVKDGKAEDATREVEQIKAFRDTWELGIYSYLSYLRDRLVVARDLLTESGSIFLQIGDENVHLVRSLLDEVFGAENFVSLITYGKTGGATAEFLPNTSDFVLWYAVDRNRMKFRRLYLPKRAGEAGADKYDQVEQRDGQRLPAASMRGVDSPDRLFRLDNLTSPRVREARTGYYPVDIDGRTFLPRAGEWKTHRAGMAQLMAARRVAVTGQSLSYVRYLDDFAAFPMNNNWPDVGGVQSRSDPKVYVVQSAITAPQRCLLMTTDPGDLVLDPTCGSGTTAFVAEQWGRRWITIDTSRVAIALARQRVMGAKLPYYLLADSPAGRKKERDLTGVEQPTTPTGDDVRKGFVYERVPHVTLKSIANNPDIREGMSRGEIDAAIAKHAETETLFDRPYEDKRKVRVSGPFTVESLSPHRAAAFEMEQPQSEQAGQQQPDGSSFEQTILDNLLKAGVQNGWRNERLELATLAPYAHPYVQAEATRRDAEDGTPTRIAISIGPQYGTVDSDWIKSAAREALRGQGFDLLLVCGFAFDARVIETVDEFRPEGAGQDFAAVQSERRLGRLPILIVRMNADLAMGDVLLKKTGSGNLFTVFGEPDVLVKDVDGQLVVEIRGVDVYNPTTGDVRSSDTDDIAMWMIDTDYNEESFFVRHCYFTGGGTDPYARLKRALKADIDEAAWATLYDTTSRPFPRPSSGKIAVKVIDHYGDEVLKVYEV